MVELPLAMWLLFICIGFPLISLSTMALRYAFVVIAAHDAAKAAARAPQFASDIPESPPEPLRLSALNAAQTTATKVCNSFAGIKIEPPINVTILEYAPSAGSPSVTTHPTNTALSQAYTPGSLYKIKVDVTATVDPLITVPGVIGPYSTTVSAQQVAENVQGLNK